MTVATIYHNQKCSKSRETLALLQRRGVVVEIVDYLHAPPSVEKLDQLVRGLGIQPVRLARAKDLQALGYSQSDQRSWDEWLHLLHKHPKVIQRPIVECNGRVAMGRPPENVLTIL